jgi:hypothetical protein
MIFSDVNPYVAIAVAGLFTGIGSATGAAIVELWIKPHLHKIKEDPKVLKEAIVDYLGRLEEGMKKNGRS